LINFLDRIILAIETTAPNRTVTGYGGEAVQEGFSNIFNIGDQIQCAFIGLFTGDWTCWIW